MFQKILGFAVLAIGAVYAVVILRSLYKDKEGFLAARGDLRLTAAAEFLVFAISCLGVSDFLLNTLVAKRFDLADDRDLPGTMVGCTIVPSSLIACILLNRSSGGLDTLTLVLCAVCVMTGSVFGSRLVAGMDGAKIRMIMKIALIASLVFLIIKMIVSAGLTGTAAGLSGFKLILAAALCFFAGVVNMFGIPMKPTWTALFLIMGLSPLATLTMVLVLGAMTPLTGAVNVLKAGHYQKKMVGSAVVTGTMGALLGALTAVSIPGTTLNVTLVTVMLIAIVSMFKK